MRVISCAVPFRQNAFIDIGVAHYIFSHTKKGGLSFESAQHIQHPWRHFRDWAVVKGEVKDGFVGRHAPQEAWPEHLNNVGRFNQVHDKEAVCLRLKRYFKGYPTFAGISQILEAAFVAFNVNLTLLLLVKNGSIPQRLLI